MKNNLIKAGLITSVLSIGLFSCKDKEPDVKPGPSTGKTIQVEGIAGSEPGTSALNSVFIDFSSDVLKSVRRDQWDLGFYGGDKNRVILNYTSTATAIVTDKTDINAVSAADTVGVKTTFSMMDMSPEDLNLVDDISGDLNKTVIPEVKASDNKVVIINRGTGNGIAPRDYYKIQVELLPSGNYSLKYAKLDAATFSTIEVPKDSDYNFKLVSFDNGLVEKPSKNNWDILWTASIYKTSFGSSEVPYSFSDMVAINYLAGTRAAEKSYDNDDDAASAYDKYSNADLAAETFSDYRWFIGSGWRRTAVPGSTTPAGTLKNKFYVVKDAEGNAYKIKFVSFTAEDGGERGRPEIRYELIK